MSAPSQPIYGTLLTDDYLRSDGRYLTTEGHDFFGILGTHGNFGMYSGSGPSDPTAKLIARVPNVPHPQGNYFIQMQSDGNLVIYKGTGPSDNQGFVWGLNQVRPDMMPRPTGRGYEAVLTSQGNFCVYDRNPGHDPLEGPYWSLIPSYESEDEEFTATNVVTVSDLRPVPPNPQPLIRWSIQPMNTCELTRVTLSVGTAQPLEEQMVKLAVYRGGLDSTELMNAETFPVRYLDPKEMWKSQQRQEHVFKLRPLLVGTGLFQGRIYTLELSPVDPTARWLNVGLRHQPQSMGYEDLMCFTAWTQRPWEPL